MKDYGSVLMRAYDGISVSVVVVVVGECEDEMIFSRSTRWQPTVETRYDAIFDASWRCICWELGRLRLAD